MKQCLNFDKTSVESEARFVNNFECSLTNMTYIDELIEITKDNLTINKYPFTKQKIIPINQIDNIELILLDRINGKYTFFGFCYKFYFYHYDRNRPFKKYGIVLTIKNSKLKLGITPNNPNKCFALLTKLVKGEKESSEIDYLFEDSHSKLE